MIYLKNTTDTQLVRILANGPKADGEIVLRMVNTINRGPGSRLDVTRGRDAYVPLVGAEDAYIHDANDFQVYVRDVALDNSRTYYQGTVELPAGIPDGEYEYTFTVGGVVVSCGLAIVGEPKSRAVQYSNTVQYEQYRSK